VLGKGNLLLVFFVLPLYNWHTKFHMKRQKEQGMELDWLTPVQIAEKWGITERQVQSLCLHGKIPGATKVSKVWLIPKNASKPIDGRTKAAKEKKGKTVKREK
jgi:hypothetical protein